MTAPKKTIMIAEDDEGIIDVMTIILEDAGYNVVPSSNGQAVYELDTEYPDLFLLDIWMSGVDGSKICRYVKSHHVMKHIPVIIVSANKDTEKIAREAGADDFLAKPFEMKELIEKVSTQINKKILQKGKTA